MAQRLHSARSPVVAESDPSSDRTFGGETVPGHSANGTRRLAAEVWGFTGLFRALVMSRKGECCSHATRVSQVHADLRSVYLLPSGASASVGRSASLSATCGVPNVEATLRTLLLLLYGTGIRVGEALRLRLADVDLDGGVITIRGTKFYKSRLVPLGTDVVQVLRKYLATPGRWNQPYRPFFQSRQHKRLGHST